MKRKHYSVEQSVAVLKLAEQVKELKQLQDKNARMKKLVAELSRDKAILQDVAAQKLGVPF